MKSKDLNQPATYFTGAVAALTVLMSVLPAQALPGPAFDFAAIDADKNGQITTAEMDAFKAVRVAELDSDKDGFVSAEEMAADMIARMTYRIETMARHRLVDQDKDGDGKVSLAEMAEGSGEGRMFARADANGDGALSAEEVATVRAHMEDRMKDRGGKHRGGEGHGKGGMGGPFWLFDDAGDAPEN